MSTNASASKRFTVNDFKRMKLAGEKIAVVTAYDAAVARLVDEAGVDCILVGDSVGMVVQGYDSTLSVTLDQMIYHSSAVRRGLARAHGRAHLVVDMPFGTYQAGQDAAVENAMRLIAQGGAEAVKLEGGGEYVEVIRRISRAGIPVMGHIGLTPQSIHKLGGYVVQGKDSEKARELLQDARELEKAGCYAVVLECIPSELAATITRQIGIATIGIGAGPHCDGQVLVIQDLLGIDTGVSPKFVKRYASLGETIGDAVQGYVGEVRKGIFPADEHSFHSATLQIVPGDDTDDSCSSAGHKAPPTSR